MYTNSKAQKLYNEVKQSFTLQIKHDSVRGDLGGKHTTQSITIVSTRIARGIDGTGLRGASSAEWIRHWTRDLESCCRFESRSGELLPCSNPVLESCSHVRIPFWRAASMFESRSGELLPVRIPFWRAAAGSNPGSPGFWRAARFASRYFRHLESCRLEYR